MIQRETFTIEGFLKMMKNIYCVVCDILMQLCNFILIIDRSSCFSWALLVLQLLFLVGVRYRKTIRQA